MQNVNTTIATSAARASAAAEHQQMVDQIDRGIHITFFFSILALPFSYLTQIVLARTSQDAVGIFAGILLWVAFATGFFYFGGNPVLIKFLPELSATNQLPFVLSYSALILALTLVGTLALAFLPHRLESLAGTGFTGYLFPLLLLIALLNIFQQASLSTLKGLLELTAAQLLNRISTVGYLVSFGTVLLLAKPWFNAHPVFLITAVHLTVIGLSLLLGGIYLARRLKPGVHALRWYLPDGFWHFSLMTQLSSMTNFFYSRLDQVFVFVYASIGGLGIYFVIVQVAAAIQLISGFFLDGLLAALTNVLARMGDEATRSIYYQGARLNQVIVTGCTLVLICFHRIILACFGGAYLNQWHVLLVLVVFTGINSLGSLNAYLLTAYGEMPLLLLCQVLQIVVFLGLFISLGGKGSLFMLALAQGLAMTAGLFATVVATTHHLRLGLHVPREFWASLGVLVAAAGLAAWVGPLPVTGALLLLLVSQALFFVLGGYRLAEMQSLIALLRLPSRNRGDLSYSTKIFTLPAQAMYPAKNNPEQKL